ncbi:uncharacterized protein [Argopecten irradians]|uniref:uncharacterized protein n=1 Tax=Argopecten irradians TaxID=31199 RepID=UPI0037130428
MAVTQISVPLSNIKYLTFIFFVSVLIALFPKEKRNQYLFLEDFHSCYLGGEWIPVSTNLAVLPAPCFIIVIVSLMSFYNPLLYKTAVVVPADVSYASNSVIVPRRQMMYLESTNPPSNRKMSIVSDFNIPPDSVNSENIYEMKTAPHLPLFNTILTGMIIIRLCLMVASRHVPTGESIQTTILVCFVLRIYIQTIFLLITSFRSRKAIQSLNFKPQSSMEKHMSVRKGQSLPLVPRDDFAYMPDFLKQPSDMDINVHVVQSSDSVRSVKRVSFPLAAVTSSFDLDPRTANDLARRRVTISVI